MNRSTISSVFLTALLLSVPAHAQGEAPCTIKTGKKSSCAPIIGCIPATGVFFSGRALGWNKGILAGTTSDGAVCTGDWVSRNALGLGASNIFCDNGVNAKVFFFYQDSLTGTATGHGITNSGNKIQVWAGQNIKAYISKETGQVDPKLLCGTTEIPIS